MFWFARFWKVTIFKSWQYLLFSIVPIWQWLLKSIIDNIFYHSWLTTIKRWNLIVMKVPYNSVFCFPFNFPKPNMQLHIIPLKKRFKLYWKESTFCNICLSQSSDTVIKNYNMCNNVQARKNVLKSWCRLILQYTLPHKLFAAPRCWNPLL